MGYTRSTTGGRLWRTVHPHSRGVYGMVRSRGGGSTAVHPHSRGVYKTTGLELIDDCGSSPLAWGILHFHDERRLPDTVHPHSRGVYVHVSRFGMNMIAGSSPLAWGIRKEARHKRAASYGSSPLAWGIHGDDTHAQKNERFIPTRVGYTFLARVFFDHGHGSSPLAWGIHRLPGSICSRSPVHPHSRGVYCSKAIRRFSGNGSSPLAWGIHPPISFLAGPTRFIPTRVGYTRHAVSPRFRLCGSSPLAWGIPLPPVLCRGRGAVHPHSRGVYYALAFRRAFLRRFIPTRVGYTSTRRAGAGPRVRFIPTRVGYTEQRCERWCVLRFIPTRVGYTILPFSFPGI